MAGKAFLTIEESAARLKKTTAEVSTLADKGLLQRVMHEGQTKFRIEQVEMLAGDDRGPGSHDPIGLADSHAASGTHVPITSAKGKSPATPLDDSVLGFADSRANERTGVSAVSARSKGGDAVEIGLETVGSGSGLLDLTRESEETALGAELMEQAFKDDGSDSVGGATGLFSAADMSNSSNANAAPEPMGFMVAQESYDGSWSGVGIGLTVAAAIGLVVVALIIVSSAVGGSSALAASLSGDSQLIWIGVLAGVTAIFGVVGFFIGRATE